MRKRANLLLQKKDYFKLEKYFYYFRGFTVGFGIVSIIILIIIVYMMIGLRLENDRINLQISDNQKYINKNADIKTGINYFNQKNNLLSDILKNDVNFLPYYNKLNEFIPVSTEEAAISNVNFNNKREIGFTLNFNSYDEFISFLGALQNQSFLEIFDKLSLESFSIREGELTKYALQLIGIMKPLEVSIVSAK
jgi:hypothetical protein